MDLSGTNHETVKTFFDAWSIYAEVLERNYMFHDELFAEVGRTVGQLFGVASFSVMDLGCGSAHHISEALRGRKVSRYVGYDLSDVALARARENLAALNCPIELRHADLLAGLDDEPTQADLVFSSFALHHLKSADKELFFRRALRRLTDNGRLLLIDVALADGESRAAWLDRYCGWMRADWTSLPAQALEMAFGHICQYDFPESSATFHRMASDAGFSHARDLCQFWGTTRGFFQNAGALKSETSLLIMFSRPTPLARRISSSRRPPSRGLARWGACAVPG